MFRQTISLTTLVVFVIYTFAVSGCTKSVTISIDQVHIPPRATVTQLELKTGELVTFDSTGGRYIKPSGAIAGNADDSSRRAVKLSQINLVHFTIEGDTARYTSASDDFKMNEDNRYHGNLKGRITTVTTRASRIDFDGQHGRIDSVHRAITGTSKYGTPVNVPFEEVVAFKVKRTDHLKTWLAFGGVALALYYVFYHVPKEIGEGFEGAGASSRPTR